MYKFISSVFVHFRIQHRVAVALLMGRPVGSVRVSNLKCIVEFIFQTEWKTGGFF